MSTRFTPASPPLAEVPVELHRSLSEALRTLGQPLAAPTGSVLFREGDMVKGVFLLNKGVVRLSLSNARKSITYRVVRDKYVLGLPATLLHRPYSLTAEVLEDAELRFINWDEAMAYLREHADMCMHVLEFLSHEMVWIRHLHAAHFGDGSLPLR